MCRMDLSSLGAPAGDAGVNDDGLIRGGFSMSEYGNELAGYHYMRKKGQRRIARGFPIEIC